MKKEIIFTKKTPLPGGQFSQAIKAGDFIFVSGQTPRDLKTREILAPGDIEAQTDIVMKYIETMCPKEKYPNFQEKKPQIEDAIIEILEKDSKFQITGISGLFIAKKPIKAQI